MFIADFSGECERCDAPVERGQDAVMLDYDRGLVAHASCPASSRPVPVCSGCNLAHAGECF